MSASKRRSNSKLDLTEQQQAAVLEAFSLFDREKKGEIKATDVKLVMRALGFEPRRDEIKKVTSELDKNGTGKITYDKFLSYMATKIAEKDTREEILKAFRLFDDDQTGKISYQNLKRVAQELGENISEEELKEMLEEADQDGDGEVNQEEFFRIMKKTCLY